MSGIAEQKPDSRLVIVDRRFDFGTVTQNVTVSRSFWFKSVGSDTVQITKITTGCDCATMPLPRDWIAPGDSMLVRVNWDIGRDIGNTGRYPKVYINGQEEPERVFLTARVAPLPSQDFPISFKPFIAEFTRFGRISVDTVTVTIASQINSALRLEVLSQVPEVSVVTSDSIPANGTGTISITLKPEYVGTEFAESITVRYSGTGTNGQFTIPIRRKIMS